MFLAGESSTITGGVKFLVHGTPRSMERVRVNAQGERPRFFNGVADLERSFTHAAQEAIDDAGVTGMETFEGPVKVHVVFVFPRPLRHWDQNTTPPTILPQFQQNHRKSTPDVDNLTKFVLDALNGVAYKDDRQVCELCASKRYSNHFRSTWLREGYTLVKIVHMH